MIDQSNRTSGSIMAGPAYSPDGMGYMLGAAAAGSAGSTPASAVDQQAAAFRSALGGSADSTGATAAAASLASHAAMQSAMAAGAYSAQHLSQYGRTQHSAMLGLSAGQTAGAGAGAHMMGAHATLNPHDYSY